MPHSWISPQIQIIIQWVSGEKLWIEEERLLPLLLAPPPLLRIYYKPTSLEWSSLSHVMTLLPAIISTTIINAFFGFYNFGPQSFQSSKSLVSKLWVLRSYYNYDVLPNVWKCSDSVLPFLSLLFYFREKKDFSVLSKSTIAAVRGKRYTVPFGQPRLLGRVSHVRKVKSWGLWMVSYTVYFIILNVLMQICFIFYQPLKGGIIQWMVLKNMFDVVGAGLDMSGLYMYFLVSWFYFFLI